MNQVLVIRNNGESCAFPASTPKEVHDAALYILKLRQQRGFYPVPKEVEKLGYTAQFVKKVPHEPIREFIRQSVKDWTQREIEYQKAKWFADRVSKAIESGDGELALAILNERKHREGEKFEMLNLIVLDSTKAEDNSVQVQG